MNDGAELTIDNPALYPDPTRIRLTKELLQHDVQTIIFGRARRTVEIVLNYLREAVESVPPKLAADSDSRVLQPFGVERERGAIRAYRSGYLPRQRRDLIQNRIHVPADLGAARSRNDAVAAAMITSLADGDVRLAGIALRSPDLLVRKVDRVGALLQIDRPARPVASEQFSQAAGSPGAENEVDMRRPFEDALALLLCHATADADHHARIQPLEPFQPAQFAEHLLCRLLSDGAGIEQYEVGPLRAGRPAVAFPLQRAGQLLRVVDVHLAAPSLDVVAAGGGLTHLGALSACARSREDPPV